MSGKIEVCGSCGEIPQRGSLLVMEGVPNCYVRCYNCGWQVVKSSSEEAVSAWNYIMHRVRMMKRLQEPIGEPRDSGGKVG